MPVYYLDDIKLSSFNDDTLKGFVQDSIERTSLFYTHYGVFTVKEGKLFRVSVENDLVEHSTYKGLSITIDNRVEVLSQVTSQMPNDYYVRRIEVVNYKVPGNNHAYLTLTYEKDVVIDAFFKSDHDINTPMLQTTIDTFLSNLN